MSYRLKLTLLFALTVAVTVALVASLVTAGTQRAFEQGNEQRTNTAVAQFQREFSGRGNEVERQVEGIASSSSLLRMAVELSRPGADPAPYLNDAQELATAHHLDFLELAGSDGTIVSSAQWPARFGYKDEMVLEPLDWKSAGPFIRREELADGVSLSLTAVRVIQVNERNLYVVGGARLDKGFLASLIPPPGMRVMLYQNTAPSFAPLFLTDSAGPVAQPDKLLPLLSAEFAAPKEMSQPVNWTGDAAEAETVHALPLYGRKRELLGVLLVASSHRELAALETHIRNVALAVGGAGIALALLISGWAAARVTRPVQELAEAAEQYGKGNWDARVLVTSQDELGKLGDAFNRMGAQLGEQRDKLVQTERVAAWRELARRLAHELKNPLFPLQITVENLVRSREQAPEQFDDVFRESTTALLGELNNLKTIVGRFSDFSKMPAPQWQRVQLNEVVTAVMKIFEAQLRAPRGEAKAGIATEMRLAADLPPIQADPELLHRALSNLILNAMDAMPEGGRLSVSTERGDGAVRIEIADTGQGLTPEECGRLFTPYYTSKQHGTGLGLAIVQSVVSDHRGKITVESEKDKGTKFRIDLPLQQAEGQHA